LRVASWRGKLDQARKWSAGILPADVTASRAVTLVAETMLVTLARTCAQSGRGNGRRASVERSRSTHQGVGAGRRRISRQGCQRSTSLRVIGSRWARSGPRVWTSIPPIGDRDSTDVDW